MKTQLFLSFILLLVTASFQTSASPVTDPPDICQQPENILPNCNFDRGLDGWQSFTEDGGANFAVLQGGGECHAPLCPAAYIATEGHFVGGFYQQVPVTKGNTYYANVVWLVFDSLSNDASIQSQVGGIGRKLGIDPFGGTDPRSPNVIWGPENWRNDCKICDGQEVTATAQADTITLFLRIDDRWKLRAAEKGFSPPPSKDQFWIDDIGMRSVDGAAVVPSTNATEPPPPTDTPAPPPTDTPLPAPPTDTPIPAPNTPLPVTETPEVVAQAQALEVQQPLSPVETPVAISTVAPPPTLTPTIPPLPTDTPAPRQRPLSTPTHQPRFTPEPELSILSAGLLGVAGTTICAGGGILVLMGVIMTGLVWLYRLGWGKVEDDEAGDLGGDDLIVEVIEDDEDRY